MTTTLKRGPNGPFLELDPEMLSEAGIDWETPLDVIHHGGRLTVQPHAATLDEPADREQAFRVAMDKVNHRYGRMLKRLAE